MSNTKVFNTRNTGRWRSVQQSAGEWTHPDERQHCVLNSLTNIDHWQWCYKHLTTMIWKYIDMDAKEGRKTSKFNPRQDILSLDPDTQSVCQAHKYKENTKTNKKTNTQRQIHTCGNRSAKMSPHQACGWRRRCCFAVDLVLHDQWWSITINDNQW